HEGARTNLLRRLQPTVDPARVNAPADLRQVGPRTRHEAARHAIVRGRLVTADTAGLLDEKAAEVGGPVGGELGGELTRQVAKGVVVQRLGVEVRRFPEDVEPRGPGQAREL